MLRAYPAARAASFFADLGVALQEEEDGKFFPTTNRARTVLDALIRALNDAGAELRPSCRISGVQRGAHGFAVSTQDGHTHDARIVVLATGGRSLPKTGSDGLGYQLARALGHGYIETTPALVPLILRPAEGPAEGPAEAGHYRRDSLHTRLAGVAHPVAVTVRSEGAGAARLEGSMLWTHFGVSGPVMLNASRHWLRARLEGRAADVLLKLAAVLDRPDYRKKAEDIFLTAAGVLKQYASGFGRMLAAGFIETTQNGVRLTRLGRE